VFAEKLSLYFAYKLSPLSILENLEKTSSIESICFVAREDLIMKPIQPPFPTIASSNPNIIMPIALV
jgi:hypothetical protein